MPGTRLLLVGSGKMGGALLAGWLARGTAAADVTVVEPQEAARAAVAARGVNTVADAAALGEFAPAAVILAVKPQQMDAVVPAYRRFAESGALVLSIAAGKAIAYFEARLGAQAAVVRAMPNTAAAVGRGITVLCANRNVARAARDLAETLMAAAGETAWIDDEAQMDAVTATSGSGPAYVFYLIECLAEAAVDAGLPTDLAMRLARATVCGAGELAYRDASPAGTLRANVTSPGGTTEAALKVLMAGDGLAALMRRAVAAATERSRELGRG